jgi:ribosomal protein S18 acetylase RimI-like enzyme
MVCTARPQDAPEVAAILSEAAAWLIERGINQWPNPYPLEEVAQSIDRGEVYLAIESGPAATFTLQSEDLLFWGEQERDALYLHRLAVRRAFAGRGLGKTLVEWAAARARSSGRDFLRLDCLATEPRIRAYYESLGFTYVRDRDMSDWTAALYERRLRP